MKRLYSRNDNRGLLSGGRAVVAVIAIVVVVLLILRLAFPGALVSLARPLWGTGTFLSAAVGSATLSFEDSESVRKERDRLASELEAKTIENATLQTKLEDITRLIGSEAEAQNRVVAGVLARPPVALYDTLIIASGSRDGVKENALVYGVGGVPIGTISRLQDDSAYVSLYSRPGRETAAFVGEVRTPLTLIGTGSGAFRAVLAKDAPAVVGDLVFVPGPGALPIGSVSKIIVDPSSPEAIVFIKPLANPFSVSWVSVGQPLP